MTVMMALTQNFSRPRSAKKLTERSCSGIAFGVAGRLSSVKYSQIIEAIHK
jgi:hypothetical protein